MSEKNQLALALLAVQAEAPKLQRDAINPHFKSSYVSLESLMGQVLPLLNAHGIVLVQSPTSLDGQPALTTELTHAESGASYTDTMPLPLDKPTSQALGSAITYARRYSLMALLGLVADADDDGNAASKPSTRAPARRRKPKDEPQLSPHERLNKVLRELSELEEREDWPAVCREFTSKHFGKVNELDLDDQERESLIAELTRRKVQLEAEPGPV
jgi:ERF superfamily protein